MAIAVDAVSSGNALEVSSITVSHTTSGSDRLMLVGVSINNNGNESVSSVTYNGVNLTSEIKKEEGNDAYSEFWVLTAPDTGTHDVVVTFDATLLQECCVGVMTLTGVDQTTPISATASNSETDEGSDASATVTISSATDELVVDCCTLETGGPLTVGAGQTERWSENNDNCYGSGSTEPGASSVTMTWSFNAPDHWSQVAVSVAPAAAAAGNPWYAYAQQ